MSMKSQVGELMTMTFWPLTWHLLYLYHVPKLELSHRVDPGRHVCTELQVLGENFQLENIHRIMEIWHTIAYTTAQGYMITTVAPKSTGEAIRAIHCAKSVNDP